MSAALHIVPTGEEVLEMTPEQARDVLARWASVGPLLVARATERPPAESEDRLIDARELAERLRVSLSSVERKTREGEYPFAVKHGDSRRYSVKGFERWLARRQSG